MINNDLLVGVDRVVRNSELAEDQFYRQQLLQGADRGLKRRVYMQLDLLVGS